MCVTVTASMGRKKVLTFSFRWLSDMTSLRDGSLQRRHTLLPCSGRLQAVALILLLPGHPTGRSGILRLRMPVVTWSVRGGLPEVHPQVGGGKSIYTFPVMSDSTPAMELWTPETPQ